MTMTTYRRKPSCVSAVQLTQDTVNAHVLDKTPLPDGCVLTSSDSHPLTRRVDHAIVRLRTEKRERVMPGDWIMRAEDGTLSVVKPEAFAEMYEAVDASERMTRAEALAAEHERHDAAMTPGPWYRRVRHLSRVPDSTGMGGHLHTNHIGVMSDMADSAGSSALRNAAPEVAAVLRGLVADLTALTEELRWRRAAAERMTPVVAAADAWRDDPCKGLGSHREAALADAVDAWRKDGAAPPNFRVLAQIIRAPSADLTGIRVIVDGEVIGTGDYGGEPEDNCEYRDYKWVKELLVTLARRLGAEATIESVEVDGATERAASEAYYAAMAAKPTTGGTP